MFTKARTLARLLKNLDRIPAIERRLNEVHGRITPKSNGAAPYRDKIKADWAESDYYEEAERVWHGIFWGENSPFFKLYSRLNTDRVLDLACGHGRHTEEILSRSSPSVVYLVDINQSNIDFCRARFADDSRVRFILNQGNDLGGIKDGELTAALCYDAMVHFEYDDVFSYIEELWRVLAPGGRALMHHSNNDKRPGTTYDENPHWRNFMSAPLFKHVAMRNGFQVIEQVILCWGADDALDCASLIEKPAAQNGGLR